MAHRVQRFNSRQSMREKHFEIFHYRDKKPENIGVHHHDFFELYFFLSGDVEFSVEGRHYCLERGDILLISPLELHQAKIEQDKMYERMVLWMDCDYLRTLGGDSIDLSACFDRSGTKYTNLIRPDKLHRTYLLTLLEKLNSEFYGSNPDSRIYAEALLIQFLIEINRHARQAEDILAVSDEPDLIEQVLTYIGTHYQEELSLEKLASEFFVSKYYLSHEFQRRVGTSIYRYVIFRRLMQARQMMLSGMTPGEVSEACGFGDYANFYRAFKAEYRISPREFLQSKKE